MIMLPLRCPCPTVPPAPKGEAHVQTRDNCLPLCTLSTPSQEELNLTKDMFRERYGENPRKDDLTILVPRQDDPTEQVGATDVYCPSIPFAHQALRAVLSC